MTSSFSHRVVMVGNSHVGKTSIVQRLVFKEFQSNVVQTVGAAFFTHTIDFDGLDVNLQIWDTAGQERYKSIGPIYYRNSAAAVVVYDQTNKSSYEALEGWIQSVKTVALPNCKIYIAANKNDMGDEMVVPEHIAMQYCREKGYQYFSCSALTGENIDMLFNRIAFDLLDQEAPDKLFLLQSSGESSSANFGKQKTCNC